MSKPKRKIDERTQELIDQTKAIPIEVIERAIKQSLIGDDNEPVQVDEIEVKTKETIEKENQPYTVIDETTPGVSIILGTSRKKKVAVKGTKKKFRANKSSCRAVKARDKQKKISQTSLFDSHRRFNLMMLLGTLCTLILVLQLPVHRTIVIIDGAQPPVHVMTTHTDVDKILSENHIVLGEEDEIANNLVRVSAPGDVIKITRITYSEEIERLELPYEEEIIEDSMLFEGNVIVNAEGIPGLKEIVLRSRFVNGEFESKQIISEDITEPVNKVMTVGTRPVLASSEWASGQMTGYSGNCSASGYCGSHIYNGPIGNDLRIVAAPSEIPFCTIIEFTDLKIPGVPQTIQAIVLERGSAIHGNVFDLLQPDFASSASVGRQHMQFRILELGNGSRNCWQ